MIKLKDISDFLDLISIHLLLSFKNIAQDSKNKTCGKNVTSKTQEK